LTQARIGTRKLTVNQLSRPQIRYTNTSKFGFFASLQENECPLWQSKTEMAPTRE